MTQRLSAFDLATALAQMVTDDDVPTLQRRAPESPPGIPATLGEDASTHIRDAHEKQTQWLIATFWTIGLAMVALAVYLFAAVDISH